MGADFLTENAFAQMDSRPILALFFVTLIAVYLIARTYKNHYEMNKVLKTYALFALGILLLNLFLGIKIALVIGIILMGLIVLIFRSNTYFYGR
ncbi:hypothetical protein [Lacticigenium naphthae]|uniref:hypothetical protein n=1 Tax=Lacticigenium naphthae TaxID=515351 RepID=UPI000402DE33|nr:hypothetical protein [Lacticigenium naphthae]